MEERCKALVGSGYSAIDLVALLLGLAAAIEPAGSTSRNQQSTLPRSTTPA